MSKLRYIIAGCSRNRSHACAHDATKCQHVAYRVVEVLAFSDFKTPIIYMQSMQTISCIM